MKATLWLLGAMELLKLHFIVSYGFLAVGGAFPYLPATLAFFLSMALSRFLRRKGMRLIFFAFIEMIAFAAVFVGMYSMYRGEAFDPGAILPRNDAELVTFISMLTASALFWFRALWLEAQKVDHEFCALRFDEGIALFLMGLSISALVRVENTFPARLAIPYFLFAILALGSSKNESARRGGLSRNSRKAMVAGAAIVFVVAAIGVILLVPALTEPARQAAGALKGASLKLLAMIGDFLDWLFKARRPTFADRSEVGGAPPPPPRGAGDESPFSAIVMWIVLGIAGAFILGMIGYLLFELFRLLAGRTKKPVDEAGRFDPLAWLKAFFRAIARLAALLLGFGRRRRGRRRAALEAYAGLLAGGRAAAAARKANETPREYARRLAATFPNTAGTAGRAAFIAQEVEREVYGGAAGDSAAAAQLREMRRKLRVRSFIAERLRAIVFKNSSSS
ncbi:MAG: hypothetical protein ACYC1A_09200 [Spirochaetales bacterium]